MPEYRRLWLPGSYFVTIVTYHRRRVFTEEPTVQCWRDALAQAKHEHPFNIDAAVILPDHMHLIVNLPPGETDLSKRIGRAKALFTKLCRVTCDHAQPIGPLRRDQREAGLWQRRFYDHWLRDEADYEACFDYLHYNPVHHGYAHIPADWPWSSFHHWVRRGVYDAHWGQAVNAEQMQRAAEHARE